MATILQQTISPFVFLAYIRPLSVCVSSKRHFFYSSAWDLADGSGKNDSRQNRFNLHFNPFLFPPHAGEIARENAFHSKLMSVCAYKHTHTPGQFIYVLLFTLRVFFLNIVRISEYRCGCIFLFFFF